MTPYPGTRRYTWLSVFGSFSIDLSRQEGLVRETKSKLALYTLLTGGLKGIAMFFRAR